MTLSILLLGDGGAQRGKLGSRSKLVTAFLLKKGTQRQFGSEEEAPNANGT